MPFLCTDLWHSVVTANSFMLITVLRALPPCSTTVQVSYWERRIESRDPIFVMGAIEGNNKIERVV